MRTDLGQWLCQSSFCLWGRRGGPVCRLCVAAGSCPWHERGARATGAPSSVTTFGRASLPLLAFGHFPLTGGIGLPPWRGKAFRRLIAAPTKKRERSEISVGAGPRPARGRPHGAAPTGSPSPKGRLSGDRKGRPYVFPKTAGGSGTRPYKRQNRFGYAVGAGYWPARPGMGDG